MREQLSPSLSIREPKDRPKELELTEKAKLPKIEQEIFTERMDDAAKIFRMQQSEEEIIGILEKAEPDQS